MPRDTKTNETPTAPNSGRGPQAALLPRAERGASQGNCSRGAGSPANRGAQHLSGGVLDLGVSKNQVPVYRPRIVGRALVMRT